MPSHSNHLRAIFQALLGYACWTGADTLMKLAGSTAVPKYEIIIIGGISGMLSIFLVTAFRNEPPQLRPHRYAGLIALSLFFCLSYGLFALTLSHMPLANFYAIIFIAPILISGCSSALLRETISLKEWAAVIFAFVGVVIAINPVHLFDAANDWHFVAIALVGMLSMTAQMLLIRVLSRTETRECMAFYPRLGPCMAGLLLTLFLGTVPIPFPVWIYAIGTGAVGGLGWIFIAHAYKSAPAGTIAPFQYCEIVLGAAFGYVIWGDIPSRHVLLGATIIVASGIYVVRHLRRTPARRSLALETLT